MDGLRSIMNECYIFETETERQRVKNDMQELGLQPECGEASYRV